MHRLTAHNSIMSRSSGHARSDLFDRRRRLLMDRLGRVSRRTNGGRVATLTAFSQQTVSFVERLVKPFLDDAVAFRPRRVIPPLRDGQRGFGRAAGAGPIWTTSTTSTASLPCATKAARCRRSVARRTTALRRPADTARGAGFERSAASPRTPDAYTSDMQISNGASHGRKLSKFIQDCTICRSCCGRGSDPSTSK